MPDKDNAPQVYYIPENFIAESRVGRGQIRFPLRKIVDAVIFGVILGILAVVLINTIFAGSDTTTKVIVATVCVAPGIMFGLTGIDGEPVSNIVISYYEWRKKRQHRVFNTKPRLLGTDPVKSITSSTTGMSKLVGKYRDWEKEKAEKMINERLVEGQDFEFVYDPNIDGYAEDNGDYDTAEKDNVVEIAAGSDMSAFNDLWDEVSTDGVESDWDESDLPFNEGGYTFE